MTNIIDLTTVTIKTKRLRLVPIDFSYANEIFINFSAEVTLYMNPRPARDIEETKAFIRSGMCGLKEGKDLQLVIVDNTAGEFIGCAGLHNIGQKDPELGIWTKISSHGNGYGLEAITGIIDWAGKNIDFEYLRYPVDKRNLPSRRIPERNGGIIKKEYKKINQSGFELDEVEYWIYKNESQSG